MMDLDKATGRVLRYGVYLAIAILVLGAIVLQFAEGVGNTLLNTGVAFLVLTPFFSIVISAFSLYTEGDYRWMRIALVVLAITIAGIIVAFFF